MSAPVRIWLRRTKGWRMPPNTVKVTRGKGLKWGNVFVPKDETPEAVLQAVADFRRYLTAGHANVFFMFVERFLDRRLAGEADMNGDTILGLASLMTLHAMDLREDLPELRGKNLACWCKPGAPCHADVLLELANGP